MNRGPARVVFGVVATVLVLGFVSQSLMPGWLWDHEPFHAAMEGMETFAAFAVAALLLLLQDRNTDLSR
ncbi:MAG: hypothetical protein ABIH23_17445, partial [bacterium]